VAGNSGCKNQDANIGTLTTVTNNLTKRINTVCKEKKFYLTADWIDTSTADWIQN